MTLDMGTEATFIKGGSFEPVEIRPRLASVALEDLIAQRDKLSRRIDALQSGKGLAAKFIDGWLNDTGRTFDPVVLGEFLSAWESFKESNP